MKSDLHDIAVIYQTQTDRAVCIREVEDGPDIWIPKAQCEITLHEGDIFGRLTRGRVAVLTAPESVLVDKGLI